MIFTVGYVFSDESTPRDEYFTTVKADNADDALTLAWLKASDCGQERVMTTGVFTDSAIR